MCRILSGGLHGVRRGGYLVPGRGGYLVPGRGGYLVPGRGGYLVPGGGGCLTPCLCLNLVDPLCDKICFLLDNQLDWTGFPSPGPLVLWWVSDGLFCVCLIDMGVCLVCQDTSMM